MIDAAKCKVQQVSVDVDVRHSNKLQPDTTVAMHGTIVPNSWQCIKYAMIVCPLYSSDVIMTSSVHTDFTSCLIIFHTLMTVLPRMWRSEGLRAPDPTPLALFTPGRSGMGIEIVHHEQDKSIICTTALLCHLNYEPKVVVSS